MTTYNNKRWPVDVLSSGVDLLYQRFNMPYQVACENGSMTTFMLKFFLAENVYKHSTTKC